MGSFFLGTIDDGRGQAAAVIAEESVFVIPGRPPLRELLGDWDAALDRLEDWLRSGSLEDPEPAETARLLPPVPAPPNLYMVGANYADHAREMNGLEDGAPVEKSAEGPFIFLKPTTTLVGDGTPVRLPRRYERVDWEVELAAIAGHRADSAGGTAAEIAGYTIVNDVSVRDAFRRGEAAEGPMTWDWFAQKGWHTSCPCGPWIVPARFCPDVSDLAIRLLVNGRVEQDSRTSEMLFSLAEIVAYISTIVPLVPGDIVATGTPAGVGAGKSRFLAAGDVMAAEIERIGALRNPVAAAGAQP